ncbi:hypothetical protein GIW45_21385 [Pseudomonas congelans]|uniref:hypothetical protein n=1 Tax=Pseudomonas congelans TaxID=200452 RepID=UPI0013CEAE54|nr:hypothetical protein [Pseudomonas congelans]MCF5166549.1 hypothetical protein [Pseudomonas congelans]
MAMLLESEIHCLKLGADLAAELVELNDDPLARWLASHIARLMRELKPAQDAGQVARASNACMHVIVKFWKHRASCPSLGQNRFRNGSAIHSLSKSVGCP